MQHRDVWKAREHIRYGFEWYVLVVPSCMYMHVGGKGLDLMFLALITHPPVHDSSCSNLGSEIRVRHSNVPLAIELPSALEIRSDYGYNIKGSYRNVPRSYRTH